MRVILDAQPGNFNAALQATEVMNEYPESNLAAVQINGVMFYVRRNKASISVTEATPPGGHGSA